jgi:hypothetical protein
MHASDPNPDDPNRWAQLAQILAAMPDLLQRLTVEHVPDEHTRCRGCTLPGTGRPNEPWPCSLRKLADQARQLQAARHVPGPDETNP